MNKIKFFTVVLLMICGSVNSFGAIKFKEKSRANLLVNVFSENFDGVIAPALPTGWTTARTGTSPPVFFATTSATPDTAPNTVFTNRSSTVSTNSLISPAILLPAGQTSFQLTFRHTRNFEGSAAQCFDGGIVELSTNGGMTFNNVTSGVVGGSFSTGDYNGTIDTGFSNPLAGQAAFCDVQATYITSTLTLPGTLSGQTIMLRWRAGWDSSSANANPNWRIDTVSLEATPPTAAGVSIGGRVSASDGRGVRNAIVVITLSNGETIQTRTGTFGYFRFDDIEVGQTVVVSVVSKRFTFAPQIVNISEDIAELNFTVQQFGE